MGKRQVTEAAQLQRLFRAPYGVPNGLQVVGDELWVVDQAVDRMGRVTFGEPMKWGMTTRLRQEHEVESSNTSGLTFGDGSLWLGANGAALVRTWPRPTDCAAGSGQVVRVDPATGATLDRFPVPGSGGVHGLEYDAVEPGHLWITHPGRKLISLMRLRDRQVVRELELPLPRVHGIVRTGDTLWAVFTEDRVLLELDLQSGAEVRRIEVPEPWPEPHGLTRHGDALLYCDATSGWIVQVAAGLP